jgi:hypothetical protein
MRTDRYNAQIVQFAAEMGHRLSENEKKQGNFEEWIVPKQYILLLIRKNLDGLTDATTPERISECCADMANYAMRMHQLYGRQVPVPNGRGRGE